ncbi:MauE/DoxX family redox-associated membrane protein [Natronomonas aquatica]|jgi:uncharacterized membrane protein|nr:MauE/DoxX family redox-associated membrane protein [Natronomonas aquatica]
MYRLLHRFKRPLRYAMAVLYVIAGVMHFLVPEVYVQIIPPVLPGPLVLVYFSGIAEIALGLGLLHPRTRRLAAWGLIGLLIAIFPANVYMATSGVVIEGTPGSGDPSEIVRWGRLPLQAVLVAWAWWYTRPPPSETAE